MNRPGGLEVLRPAAGNIVDQPDHPLAVELAGAIERNLEHLKSLQTDDGFSRVIARVIESSARCLRTSTLKP